MIEQVSSLDDLDVVSKEFDESEDDVDDSDELFYKLFDPDLDDEQRDDIYDYLLANDL